MNIIPDIKIIRDNKYRMRSIIMVNDESKEIVFSTNDYGITFISFGKKDESDNYIRAIHIPTFLPKHVIDDIKRVHPTIPIFYTQELDIIQFSYGVILGNGALNVNNS